MEAEIESAAKTVWARSSWILLDWIGIPDWAKLGRT